MIYRIHTHGDPRTRSLKPSGVSGIWREAVDSQFVVIDIKRALTWFFTQCNLLREKSHVIRSRRHF